MDHYIYVAKGLSFHSTSSPSTQNLLMDYAEKLVAYQRNLNILGWKSQNGKFRSHPCVLSYA
jgi:hypothetical protein